MVAWMTTGSGRSSDGGGAEDGRSRGAAREAAGDGCGRGCSRRTGRGLGLEVALGTNPKRRREGRSRAAQTRRQRTPELMASAAASEGGAGEEVAVAWRRRSDSGLEEGHGRGGPAKYAWLRRSCSLAAAGGRGGEARGRRGLHGRVHRAVAYWTTGTRGHANGRGRRAGLCSSLRVAARVTGSRASGAMGGKAWAQEEGRVRGARGGRWGSGARREMGSGTGGDGGWTRGRDREEGEMG